MKTTNPFVVNRLKIQNPRRLTTRKPLGNEVKRYNPRSFSLCNLKPIKGYGYKFKATNF